jgi:2-polyprenyl-3-methyl-5-hydroxy-6-metoxy-1,4-benzoquinol methylase
MDRSVLQFYDRLADNYHLLFEDWRLTVQRQGEVLDRLLTTRLGRSPLTVLDCCCGIGTQAIGMALHGHQVQGTDLSPEAIQRAVREAESFGVSIPFSVADVRTLADQVSGQFDVVLACDNALPHLIEDEDLQRAVNNMAAKLCPGGLFLASTRDYDALVQQRQQVTSPRVFQDGTGRRIVFQVWDWSADGRTYQVNQLIVRNHGADWETAHYGSVYRALQRAEFSTMLQAAGLTDIHWQMAEESGYYQPIVTARRG